MAVKTPETNTNRQKLHLWDLTPKAAMALQTTLSRRVIRRARIKPDEIATVAGVDTAYRNKSACAAVAVFSRVDLKIMEEVVITRPTRFPYIPGLLAFREGPLIEEALNRLKTVPDVLMFDGQGIAHPRRFGIASHIGLLSHIPAIGCAKTRLVGEYQAPHRTSGSISYLIDAGEVIGAVVRTRTGVKPVFVSIGHLMDLDTAIRIVLTSCRGFRLPEPLRRADHLSRKKVIASKNQRGSVEKDKLTTKARKG